MHDPPLYAALAAAATKRHDARMARWWWALPAVTLVVTAGCQDECETQVDCPTGQVCEQGACGPPRFTGGGKTPPNDAGPLDALIIIRPPADAGLDGGVPVDGGGPLDAGVDGGAGRDGGVVPDLNSRGFVWAGELRSDGGSVFHAYGELVDESTAQYQGSESSYPDDSGGTCVVRTRVLSGGAPTGYAARDILVIPGPQPNSTFAMFPVGGGRFEPLADPVERIYSQSNNAQFLITGDGSPTSVETVGGVVAAPAAVLEISPAEGSTFQVVANAPLAWLGTGLPDARLTVELFDAARAVVLTCNTADDGIYQLPAGAVNAFLAAGPTPPLALELRHDTQTSITAVAAGRSFPVTFRASWGVRFPAR
jgi:hypothetical protein